MRFSDISKISQVIKRKVVNIYVIFENLVVIKMLTISYALKQGRSNSIVRITLRICNYYHFQPESLV